VPPRYFEIIITGRQLAALVGGVVVALAVAFAGGLGVRALQPGAAPPLVAAVPPAPVRSGPPAVPNPTAVATAAPTPLPTNTPTPSPTDTPPPPRATQPVAAAAAKAGHRWVQVAALSSRKQADGARNRVIALGFAPRQVVIETAGGKFRVRVGPFPDGESAGRVSARLRAEGFRGSYVVREGD
jgi:cell division protein FtsN